MKTWVILLSLLGLAAAGCSERVNGSEEEVKVATKIVSYRHGDVELEGFLAWPEGAKGRRPGVLVVHAWMGLDDFARGRAEALARTGRVAFALDMYGKGIRPKSREEAGKQATIYRSDRALMRARARRGLEVLAEHDLVDPGRLGAIGFCFGGGTVLELARSGAEVAGVVSFHGNLDTPDPADAKNVKGAVLVLHGAADPHVPHEHVRAFVSEMEGAGVDWQMNSYGGAVHAFMDPGAGDDPSRGAAYDEKAARRAWRAMEGFFLEVLGE